MLTGLSANHEPRIPNNMASMTYDLDDICH